MNARFWIWTTAGWVKITLKPGQSLSYAEGGVTDEGYSHEFTTWAYDGTTVFRENYCDSRDCDGRHRASYQSACRLENLRDINMEEEFPEMVENIGIYRPAWKELDCEHRDEYAELMGY